MELGTIIVLALLGLLIGALARLIVPGPTDLGIIATILIGLGGTFLGYLVVYYLVTPRNGWISFAIAVLCAAVLVMIFGRPRPRTGAF